MKHNRAILANHLAKMRIKIVSNWLEELKKDEILWSSNLRFQTESKVNHCFEDLLSILRDQELSHEASCGCHFPLDTSKNEVRLLFMCEKSLVKTIQKIVSLPPEEWARVRFLLNNAFHDLMRFKIASSCAKCRCSMDEDMAKAQKMEADLKKLNAV